jgi:DNA-binding winged helix-turn-helix (wHTH) protein/tetratricopeptide (TPR) repeat protein/TolB-like protein
MISTATTTDKSTDKRPERRVYRFDELCADPMRRVLLRGGEPVPVTPKAFAILLVLLDNRGEVVSKEELIRQVWASAYVSDANLTQNISSLRKALGDRTGERRYVVTVPGQGYTFAAPVTEEAQADDISGDAPAAGELPALRPAPGSHPSSGMFPVFREAKKTGPVPAGRRPLRPDLARIGLGIACAAALVALSFYLARLDRGPLALPTALAQPRRPSVAVLGFRDLSGRPGTEWLASALSEMLTTELSAGPRVRVVSRENVARARQYLNIPESGTLDEAALEKIRSIVGSDLLVIGTYVTLDEDGERRIRLDVRVLEVPGGDIVASVGEAGKESGLFELVSRTGALLRQKLGFTELSPRQARAARALQPLDPGAMRLYAQGLERLRAADAPRAKELLEGAVESEPRSAVIRSALSEAYGLLGYDGRALEEQKRAVALAGTLPREQRLGIQASFNELSRDWSGASETYRSLWTFYPDNLEYGLKLANSLLRGGRLTEALETIAAVRRLPPPNGEDPRADVLEARIVRRLGDPAAELRAAEAAVAKGRHSGETLITIQGLIFQGDALLTMGAVDQAIAIFRQARVLAERAESPMVLGMAYANLGAALQSRGDLAEAEEASREALAIAQRIGTAVGISSQLEILGDLQRSRGDLDEALDLLGQALALYNSLGDPTMQGRVLSVTGFTRWTRGDLAGARADLERALALSRETGDRASEASILTYLGLVLERQGDLNEALRQHELAFGRFRQLGSPRQASEALARSAGVLVRLGNPGNLETARKRFEQTLQTNRRLGNRLGIAEILEGLADLQYRKGDFASSRRLAARAAQIAGESGARLSLAEALRLAGRLDQAEGHLAEARLTLERALASLGSGPASGPEKSLVGADIRLELARLTLAEGRFDEAARQAGSVAAWYRERGIAGGEADAMSLLASLGEARRAAGRARIGVGETAGRALGRPQGG